MNQQNHLFENLNRPLILDGANGSLIHKLGGKIDPVLWSSISCLTDFEIVLSVHKGYIESGAEIITTNTFRTNPAAVKQSGIKLNNGDFVKKAVAITKTAIGDSKILIAGSNSPAEDCYQKNRTISNNDLEFNHKKHIELLWENGVDFILNETQSHFDEIKIICEFCHSQRIPYVISLYFDKDLKLLSGESVFEVIDLIKYFSPLFISVNCISATVFNELSIKLEEDLIHGFYLNNGSENDNGLLDEKYSCDEYLEIIKKYINKNTLMIGACCGSNFSHIRRIRKYFDELY